MTGRLWMRVSAFPCAPMGVITFTFLAKKKKAPDSHNYCTGGRIQNGSWHDEKVRLSHISHDSDALVPAVQPQLFRLSTLIREPIIFYWPDVIVRKHVT
jgi:hypothetical protein